jgi:hypothetical protein
VDINLMGITPIIAGQEPRSGEGDMSGRVSRVLLFPFITRPALIVRHDFTTLWLAMGTQSTVNLVSHNGLHRGRLSEKQLGGSINADNPALADYLAQGNLSLYGAQTPYLLAHELGRQSSMIGMLDGYTLVTWSFATMLPLLLLLKYEKPVPQGA